MVMLYDVYYADGTMDTNVARFRYAPKNAVLINTNGGEPTVFADKFGTEWSTADTIPAGRASCGGHRLAEEHGFSFTER